MQGRTATVSALVCGQQRTESKFGGHAAVAAGSWPFCDSQSSRAAWDSCRSVRSLCSSSGESSDVKLRRWGSIQRTATERMEIMQIGSLGGCARKCFFEKKGVTVNSFRKNIVGKCGECREDYCFTRWSKEICCSTRRNRLEYCLTRWSREELRSTR